MATEPRTINAVQTTCRLLDALEEKGGAGVTELSNELGIAKSAVYNHLNTLRKQNFVVKEDEEYRLSFTYISKAEHVKKELGYYDAIVKEVEKLASETEEISQYAIEQQGQLVYLYRANGENAINLLTDVGDSEMFHCTGVGKAILANIPEEELEWIIESNGLPERTNKTITSRERLADRLEEIRERGYAIDNEEAVDGLRCVAAPIVTEDGTAGAISISGPVRRMDDEHIETELAPKVLRAANVIELNAKIPE